MRNMLVLLKESSCGYSNIKYGWYISERFY